MAHYRHEPRCRADGTSVRRSLPCAYASDAARGAPAATLRPAQHTPPHHACADDGCEAVRPDPASSARWFDGWKRSVAGAREDAATDPFLDRLPVARAPGCSTSAGAVLGIFAPGLSRLGTALSEKLFPARASPSFAILARQPGRQRFANLHDERRRQANRGSGHRPLLLRRCARCIRSSRVAPRKQETRLCGSH